MGRRARYSLFLPEFNETRIFLAYFLKVLNIKFQENPFSGSRDVPCGRTDRQTDMTNFDVFMTVHLSIFISVINQLDAQNFCFTISLFHASTCFEHMCSKHVEA